MASVLARVLVTADRIDWVIAQADGALQWLGDAIPADVRSAYLLHSRPALVRWASDLRGAIDGRQSA